MADRCSAAAVPLRADVAEQRGCVAVSLVVLLVEEGFVVVEQGAPVGDGDEEFVEGGGSGVAAGRVVVEVQVAADAPQ